MHVLLTPLPLVTAGHPGTGGVIKLEPADFEVEEIPAYLPCGEGEHLFLWVEKQGIPTDAMVQRLARALQVRPQELGTAGLKDARAVTRQWVSAPGQAAARVERIDDPALRVLEVSRHRNKLKTGHLRGNRFRVVVREVGPGALERARAVAAALAQTGVPNFFGEQRFGREGETLDIGLEVLHGGRSQAIGRAPPGRRGFLRRLALSSVQSALFNRCLARRMEDGLLHTVIDGEVMQVRASGGPFVVEDREREQQRFAAREIVPAGPMFGPKMRTCTGEAARREADVLAEADLEARHFATQGKLLQGTRRANLVWLDDVQVTGGDDWVELRFELPRGSYATVVLREAMKSEGAEAGAESGL